MKLTPEKFQEIKKACDTATGYTLWDLRLLVEEVERLSDIIKRVDAELNRLRCSWESKSQLPLPPDQL